MKQKTIGINPLEEYLSGKKLSKERQQESESSALATEQTLHNPAAKLHEQRDVIPKVQQTQDGGEKSFLPDESVLKAGSRDESLEEPLRIDTSLSGQLTIDQMGVRSQQLAGKQRITLHISAEIVDRVKNAVYWEPGLTVAGFAEEALEKALADMEAERGAPFPQRRQHRLRGGRPII